MGGGIDPEDVEGGVMACILGGVNSEQVNEFLKGLEDGWELTPEEEKVLKTLKEAKSKAEIAKLFEKEAVEF